METNNVIGSPCFVIEYQNGFVDPTIYLKQPDQIDGAKIYMFHDAFTAKHFIRMCMGQSVEILVQKQAS